MTKLHSSSPTFKIKHGRYTKTKTDISERLCPVYNAMKDKIHFLVNWKSYEAERWHFFGKLMAKIHKLNELNDLDKFIILMSSTNNQIVAWTVKFIHKSFNSRFRFYLNSGGTELFVFYISYLYIKGIAFVLILTCSVYWDRPAVTMWALSSLATPYNMMSRSDNTRWCPRWLGRHHWGSRYVDVYI